MLSSVFKNMAKGRAKRLERARPAVKAPNISGDPTSWARKAKRNTRAIIVGGIKSSVFSYWLGFLRS